MSAEQEKELNDLVLDLWEATMFIALDDVRCLALERAFVDLVKERWLTS